LRIIFDEEGTKIQFSLSKNDLIYTFTPAEETMEDWLSALKSACVLSNFHEEYKALKMIGKGSFAKVRK